MILEARGCEVEVVDLYKYPKLRGMMEEVSGDRTALPQVHSPPTNPTRTHLPWEPNPLRLVQLVVNGEYLPGGLEELQFMHDNDMHEGETTPAFQPSVIS